MNEDTGSRIKTLMEILIVSTRLGLTSFGGPIAHLGYFHEEYVRRRKWMDEAAYADLVALCQFLPGPASSQVGIGIGVVRGGLVGGLVSFLGFTLPSVIALILFALMLNTYGFEDAGWIDGMKVVAVVVVAHAIIGMAQKLTPDLERRTIALGALVITLLWQTAFTQVGVILLAGIIGFILYRNHSTDDGDTVHFPISKRVGYVCLSLFFALLVLLPVLREATSNQWMAMLDSFYRSGALVFGGGHVVLPLLEREFVPTGWMTAQEFLAGYGAAQAVPGPLFTFAAYLGTPTRARGYPPYAGEHALIVEVSPALAIERVIDLALREVPGIAPGILYVERQFGVLEIHSADLSDVIRAGEAILTGTGNSAADQLRPRVLYHDIIEDITDQHAVILNRNRQASMVLPGQSLLVYEMTPALFAAVAANEAERAAPNLTLVDVQMIGAAGRLYISGATADVTTARDRITTVLAGIEGRDH